MNHEHIKTLGRDLSPGAFHRHACLVAPCHRSRVPLWEIDIAVGTREFQVGPQTIDRAALCYLPNGIGWVEQDGSRHPLFPGALFYIRRHCEYTIALNSQPSFLVYSATFDKRDFEELIAGDDSYKRVVRAPDSRAVQDHFDRLLAWGNQQLQHEVYAALAATNQLFAAYIASQSEALVSPGLTRAKSFLDDHATERPMVDHLATLAGMSRFHFMRQFKRAYGLSPRQYQIDRQLALARQQLAQGNTVTEAAEHAGFDNVFYFSKLFKQKCGLPPSQYLRQGPLGKASHS